MCNSVYFSTDSEEDFSTIQSAHFFVVRLDAESNPEAVDLLAYTHRWFVRSRFGGCSCHFRHWTANEFGPVEDWYPEDDDDVKASQFFFDLLMRILEEGHRIDLIDIWADTSIQDIRTTDVWLNRVPRNHFRFLEGTRCELRL